MTPLTREQLDAIAQRPYLAAPVERKGPHPDPYHGATAEAIDALTDKLRSALTALGQTSGTVAARLTAMSCRGERQNARFCPVISYLRRQNVGWFDLLMFGSGRLEIQARDGWYESLLVPAAVEWFVQRFDRGEFAHLDVRNPPEPVQATSEVTDDDDVVCDFVVVDRSGV